MKLIGVDCNITERLLFQNMGQLKHNRTFVISENEVSFELSSQICTQDNKKYVIKVAYTSGPIFEKNMKRYPIFSVEIINYQIDQKHK